MERDAEGSCHIQRFYPSTFPKGQENEENFQEREKQRR
jgi:hypothetical protein